MIQDRVIRQWVKSMEDEMDRLAHESMLCPPTGEFAHGVTVGLYQGLVKARQILDEVIRNLDV